jgi:predicted GNAT superfamily acetyltransferase
MNEQNQKSLTNFDFLARSFARMQAMGHAVDIEAVTGNMSDEQKLWFCERYQRYLAQATQAKEKELS